MTSTPEPPTRKTLSRRETRALVARAGVAPSRPGTAWSAKRAVASVIAGAAAVGFLASYLAPTVAAMAEPGQEDVTSAYAETVADAQIYTAPADLSVATSLTSTAYEIYVTPTPTPTPTPEPAEVAAEPASSSAPVIPAFAAPDPGSAQAVAYGMVAARGWGDDQFSCLVALWNKESGWRVNAYNASSGAYGIPQSLPGSKMASHGADWQTNPATQIAWGLDYIAGRYGAPCGAWGHSQSVGWY